MVSTLQTDYAGRRKPLFRLALVSSLLTVLTLGIYRFWMKTRLRRFYWSSIRPGGQPLEYVGEPMEKLLGFLIAVVFLAFYIGIVNLLLMFVSFSFFNTNLWAYALSFIGIVPIIFYARYRARRYVLARTRWRGIRFGMEPGAWGYTWRALLHWLLTIVSLGLLWPRMTFLLEKYRTDRTWFGSERLHQNGRWQMLYRPFLVFLAGLVVIAIGAVVIYQGQTMPGASAIVFGVFITGYGLLHYRVHAFRLMANHKTVGPVGFVSRPRPWKVFRIYAFGYGLSVLAVATLFVALSFLFYFLILGGQSFGEDIDMSRIGQDVPFWVNTVFAMASYFLIFILWGVLTHVLVTLPLARHYTETLEISGASGLHGISQRHRDEMDHAEGFAEALDVGAAI